MGFRTGRNGMRRGKRGADMERHLEGRGENKMSCISRDYWSPFSRNDFRLLIMVTGTGPERE